MPTERRVDDVRNEPRVPQLVVVRDCRAYLVLKARAITLCKFYGLSNDIK